MRRFTEDEVKELIQTAQILAPHFSAEQFRKLMEMEQDLADSELIESAWLALELAKEYGIEVSQVPEEYRELLKARAALESAVKSLGQTRKKEQERLEKVGQAVENVTAERHRRAEELRSFEERAADRIQQLEREVEKAKKQAQIDRKQIALAVHIKSLAQRYRISSELLARVLGEFPEDQDALRLLIEAAGDYGSQLEARAALRQENEAVKVEIQQGREEASNIRAEVAQEQNLLKTLQSTRQEEDILRRFHRRYQRWVGLIECLARWEQVIPLGCDYALCHARFWVNRGFLFTRAGYVCPCCGVGRVYHDAATHQQAGFPLDKPIRIELED